ncbi:MAG: PAS domain-containing protein [Caldilineaceae bacterium]|nr:PAS domain-containing protein [Caldilineaceae bacterium]
MHNSIHILQEIPAPLVLTGLDKRIMLFNRAAETMTGYSMAEVHNLLISDLIHCSSQDNCPICADMESLMASEHPMAAGESMHRGYLSLKGRQRQKQPVYYKAAPVADSKGTVSGISLLLQPKVKPEISAPQPVDLFGLLAHQVRTYMTYVAVTAEAMQHGYSHFDSQQEGLQFIQEQAEKSADVLQQGLMLIRVLREGLFTPERVDLCDTVQSVIEGLEARHGERNIMISLPVQSYVLGNRLLLELILENLVQNAMIHAGHECSIAVTAVTNDDGMIAVHVADDGKGMAQEQLQTLFQPSGQKSSSGAIRSFHGMGLLLTKMAVESLGGKIWVKSQPSRGTRFSFSLREFVE